MGFSVPTNINLLGTYEHTRNIKVNFSNLPPFVGNNLLNNYFTCTYSYLLILTRSEAILTILSSTNKYLDTSWALTC